MRGRPVVIIINGAGGVGKDTLCGAACSKYRTVSISAVDKVKEAAQILGWHGRKMSKDRKFLADLKKLSIEYNNGPTNYMYNQFLEYGYNLGHCYDILFFHIREPEEIGKFVARVKAWNRDWPVYTVLIRRPEVDEKEYGNDSDNCVRNYEYDMTFYNIRPIEQSKDEFLRLLDYIMTAYSE